jgi:hypothetical protein
MKENDDDNKTLVYINNGTNKCFTCSSFLMLQHETCLMRGGKKWRQEMAARSGPFGVAWAQQTTAQPTPSVICFMMMRHRLSQP